MIKETRAFARSAAVVAPGITAFGWSLVVGLSLAPMTLSADVGNATTIASGLANPRGIGFAPNGALYVAEAGSGGPGPCIPSPVFPNPLRCYGETGALTRIIPGVGFQRVVTGLPSLILGNGTVEGGPVDVSFLGTAPAVVIGLGGDPATVRAAMPPKGALLGTLLHATPSGAYKVVADIAGYEAVVNPAGGTIDSNPYGVLAQPGRRIVADAGGNSIIEVLANGHTRTFAVLGAPGAQTVPTSVTEGPDGAIYVSQLTGFPFFRGTASVFRISSDGGSITTFASGFTAIVDITFDAGGALYVLEVASGQVGPPTPPTPGLGAGRLKRQCPGGAPVVLLDGLTFPGGVAIGPDGAAYVTNFGTSASGEVLRLPVTPCS
jgi:sugar lactone lactonase YvrE